jgi:hypothetical protein
MLLTILVLGIVLFNKFTPPRAVVNSKLLTFKDKLPSLSNDK